MGLNTRILLLYNFRMVNLIRMGYYGEVRTLMYSCPQLFSKLELFFCFTALHSYQIEKRVSVRAHVQALNKIMESLHMLYIFHY
jgi:hypothetical protein